MGGLARWYLPPPPRPVLPPPPSSRHPRLHTPHCFLRPLATTCNLAPGTCNLVPATCNLQPRTTCTGAGSPSSGFATTSWQECLLFFCMGFWGGVNHGVDHAAASLGYSLY